MQGFQLGLCLAAASPQAYSHSNPHNHPLSPGNCLLSLRATPEEASDLWVLIRIPREYTLSSGQLEFWPSRIRCSLRSKRGQRKVKAGGLQGNTYLGKFQNQKIQNILKSTSKEPPRLSVALREPQLWLTLSPVCLSQCLVIDNLVSGSSELNRSLLLPINPSSHSSYSQPSAGLGERGGNSFEGLFFFLKETQKETGIVR